MQERDLVLEKIISGGQTGADQGGLEAAESIGIPTGGTAPYNLMTELGAKRELVERYGLVPGPYDRKTYLTRTKLNVENSDGTVWFGHAGTPGYRATISYAERIQKPYIINPSAVSFREWVRQHDVKVLNVAGNRESKNCGIRDRVKQFLRDALEDLVGE